MTLSIPSAHAATPDVSAARSRATAWWREPLLHFAILGAALFGIDHFMALRTDDPHLIVIPAEVDEQARQLFKGSRGREPNGEELAALRKTWLDNEVLYREGLALQLDKGDSAIRERVIFKALSTVDANTRLPDHDDKLLKEWFEAHRVKYDEPARYDFQEAVLAGDAAEATVRAFVAKLNSGTSGDAEAGLRVYKARPQPTLAQSFGPEFASLLERATPGQWQAMPTRDGWRAIRVEAVTPPRRVTFEDVHGPVLQDWTDATLAEQRSAAVQDLARKYTVRNGVAAQ
ncbi:peptidyl-prolyl cis-trans isomerase [Ideonella sp. YS5]|uniref:peptidylprolyl isomerase n=1 Tax=Ideonella sp. YS5 TaxID=3453714 RepID=UPI003EEA95FD